MMKIYDGREFFYQWDLSQKITSDAFEVGDKIHFFNIRQTNALVVSAYELDGKVVADVPNILLQTAIPIKVWKYVYGENSAQTVMEDTFKVEQRAQPYDYFYTETELYELRKDIEYTAAEAKDAVSQLQTGLDNAENALELATIAEKTSTENEQARVTAEQKRALAEEHRVLAETKRVNAESDRVDAETVRENNESDRVDAEAERASAEQKRVDAENARKSDEATRDRAEVERTNAEIARQEAERTRIAEESVRKSQEYARNQNETERKTAETARNEAENQRTTAEQSRAEAEAQRVTAEQERVAAEELRQANFESLANNIGNAVKGLASGEVVRVDDVSPIEHTARVKISGENLDPTSVTVTRCGKNIFDASKLLLANGWMENNGVYSGDTLNLHEKFKQNGGIPLVSGFKPHTAYTLSFNAYQDTNEGSTGAYFQFAYNDGTSDNVYVKATTNTPYVRTANPNKVIVGLYASYGSVVTTHFSNIMLQEGDTATEYEPYNGATYTPAEDGTCEVVSVSPTMTLFTDTAGANIEVEYNQDTNAAMGNARSDLQELDKVTAELAGNMGDIETALDGIIAIQNSLIGGGSEWV